MEGTGRLMSKKRPWRVQAFAPEGIRTQAFNPTYHRARWQALLQIRRLRKNDPMLRIELCQVDPHA